MTEVHIAPSFVEYHTAPKHSFGALERACLPAEALYLTVRLSDSLSFSCGRRPPSVFCNSLSPRQESIPSRDLDTQPCQQCTLNPLSHPLSCEQILTQEVGRVSGRNLLPACVELTPWERGKVRTGAGRERSPLSHENNISVLAARLFRSLPPHQTVIMTHDPGTGAPGGWCKSAPHQRAEEDLKSTNVNFTFYERELEHQSAIKGLYKLHSLLISSPAS
ncbi:hypothetical protein NQZ68_002380 [Dissostichus eleginoides]|nr:hypothetical protein NQZ68_002380 [Dissostichus eleginoides]